MEELENRDGAETPAGTAAKPETPERHDVSGGASAPATTQRGSSTDDVEIEAEAEGQLELDSFDEPNVFVAEAVTQASSGDGPHERIKAVIEAAIYITDEPLSPEQISVAIEQPIEVVQEILARLTAEYASPSRGLTIRELAGGYKMSTKAEHHEDIRQFVRNLQPTFRLSLAALETLAVVAYKQPITGPEIMEIRGVQGAGVLKTLLDRRLIATAGRKNVVGKPMLYKTTKEFLVQFGLSSLAELPTLKEFEELGRLALNESPDEPEQNAGTTGFGEDGADAVIRPNLEEASSAEATAEDDVAEPAVGEHADGHVHDEPSHEESAADEAQGIQHAEEAEAQPDEPKRGSGETDDAAQEVSQTHG